MQVKVWMCLILGVLYSDSTYIKSSGWIFDLICLTVRKNVKVACLELCLFWIQSRPCSHFTTEWRHTDVTNERYFHLMMSKMNIFFVWRHKWMIFLLNDITDENFPLMTSQLNIFSESSLNDVTTVWRHHYNRWNFRCVFQPRSGTKPWALPWYFLQELEVRSFLPCWSWPNQDEWILR